MIFLKSTFIYFVGVDMSQHVYGGQRTAYGSHSFPSTIVGPGAQTQMLRLQSKGLYLLNRHTNNQITLYCHVIPLQVLQYMLSAFGIKTQ